MGKLAKTIQNKKISKFFSSNSYERNLELMKLLTTERKFKQIVKEARLYLNIPAKGLDSADEKAIEKWYDWLVHATDKFIESEAYKVEGNSIRRQLRDKIIGYSEARELGKKLDNRSPLNYFGAVAMTVCKKFNIPIHFKESIQKYILTDTVDAPQHNYKGGNYEPFQRPWDAGYIPINIYTQLTKDEWDELKYYVDDLAKNWNLPRHQRIPKIDDYVEVEQAYNVGVQTDHVTGKEYKVTSAEVADVLFGDTGKENKVRDMIRKIENLRKQRLTPTKRGKK